MEISGTKDMIDLQKMSHEITIFLLLTSKEASLHMNILHESVSSHPSAYPTIQVTNFFNRLRPRQNGRHFADDTFKYIFMNENVWISIENSLKFVRKGQINNIPALVQIMAWRRPGDKPLSEPMMLSLSTHICVTRPQWVKNNNYTL